MRNLLVAAILVITGCSGSDTFTEIQNQFDQSIFSNRPQNNKQFITILKLSLPPLFSSLKQENGRKVVRKDLADAIELEQTNIIRKLEKISPEIKVLYRYRLILNGIAIVAPTSARQEIASLPGVTSEEPRGFTRPELIPSMAPAAAILASEGKTSVNFIGSEKAHAKGIRGQKMTVGVLDTGIDYTHAMLSGPGTVEAYKSVDPAKPTALFPNEKVIGGIDLVGDQYNAASEVFSQRIPTPDNNPIDVSGHGSHVAGSIAGLGDGKLTYSGVAPDALLHAIKVFGSGSTSDEVVIAGLEYSADPNGDLDLTDQLDVVNLSLGSEYGFSHIMYNEAIRNLSAGGTVVVASAGNSGHNDFITGAPSAMDDAISVAASIDNMLHNWQYEASIFNFPNGEQIVTEAVQGPASKALEEITSAQGELVFIGLADVDLDETTKAQLKGKVALIDRGKVNFVAKLKRAEAGGAIGAVVVNNQPGEAFAMGGEGSAGIPAIMVTLEVGQKIKEAMKSGPVMAVLKTNEKILKPETIDTLANFSSKGPRTMDAILKPEISAPGVNIISAAVGKGDKGVANSGTSMAAPHMAGVMALLKQAFPDLTSEELKSLAMGTSKNITDKNKKPYPLSQQGAGRVQVEKAIDAVVVARPAAISFGIIGIDQAKTIAAQVTVKNISKQAITAKLQFEGHPGLVMTPVNISLEPNSERTVSLRFTLDATKLSGPVTEVDGYVKVMQQNQEVFKIATLALVKKISAVKVTSLKVLAASQIDAVDSVVELKLKNESSQGGEVLLFNKIDQDSRKPAAHGALMSRICDLQAAGYRVVGSKVQFAIKLYEPVTTWHLCEISILFDSNGDKEAEQELVGNPANRLVGLAPPDFKSVLLDASQARAIRKAYERDLDKNPAEGSKKSVLDYSPAVIDIANMKLYSNSTIAIVEVDREVLATRRSGELAVKIAVSSVDDYNVQSDDFLSQKSKWKNIDISDKAMAFRNMPEVSKIDGKGRLTVELTKGHRSDDLMVLMPQNMTTSGTLQKDHQLEVPEVEFKN